MGFKTRNHKNIFHVLNAILFVGFLNCQSQNPSWIKSEGKETYPESVFITGFAQGKKERKEEIEDFEKKIKHSAKAELLEKLKLTIRVKTIYEVSDINGKNSDHYEETIDTYSESTDANFPTDFFYDKNHNLGYAVSYLNKKETVLKLNRIIDSKTEELQALMNFADAQFSKNLVTNTIELYLNCESLIEEIELLISELLYFSNNEIKGFSKVDILEKKTYIESKIKLLKTNPVNTFDDLCSLIYINLNEIREINKKPLYIDQFIFEQTNSETEFSNILKNNLIIKLKKLGGYNILGLKPRIAYFLLSGSYRLTENDLIIQISLFSMNNNQASLDHLFEVKLKKSYLIENNIKFKTDYIEEVKPDSLLNQAKSFFEKIKGFYCDKSKSPFQYIMVNDFKLLGNDKLLLSCYYMKDALTQDIDIVVDLITHEVKIPNLGNGKLEFNKPQISIKSNMGSLNKWKFTKTF